MVNLSDPRARVVPAGWVDEIGAWDLSMAAAGLSAATRTTRTDHMRRAARALGPDPWAVSGPELLAWAGSQSWARETRRSVYASCRSFWRWGLSAGRCEISPADHLPRVRAADPAPRPTPDDVAAAGARVADERVGLILALAAGAGMRRGEIAQVHARDVVADLGGWSIIAHGKGGRDRTIPLPDSLAVRVRAACLAGGGWAFPGRIGGHLSAERVGRLAADVLPGGWTLHSLRHRFATRAHQGTHDLVAVQHLLGHASVATTQRYVAVEDGALRRAVAAAA